MSDTDYIREVEMTVIGDLLMYFGELRTKISAISPDDFYISDCQAVYKAIEEYAKTGGEKLDTVMLPEIIDGVTLLPTIKKACTYPSTSMQFDAHLSVLKHISFNRRMKSELMHIATDKGDIRLDEIQNLIEREKNGAYVKSWIDKSQAALDEFIGSIGEPIQSIKTGFPTFDRVIGGLRIPSVSIIGAYPSTGKTALALNIAAHQEQPVIIFSLEMSCAMIYERFISSMYLVDYEVFTKRYFAPGQVDEIRSMGLKLKGMQKHVFDDVYDVETQSAIIASIKPALVIVDYIQKVRTVKKTDSRRGEIDYISGMYKQIANYNQCSIILLSQISRVDKIQPTMSSLKESGALEADGDYVALLHRPYVLKKDDPSVSPETAYMLVDKNKFGQTGKIDLLFDVKHQKFYETEKYTQPEKYTPKRQNNYEDDNPFI